MKNRNNTFLNGLKKKWGYIRLKPFLLRPIAYGIYTLFLFFALWIIFQKYNNQTTPSDIKETAETMSDLDMTTTTSYTGQIEQNKENKPIAIKLLESRITNTEQNITRLQAEMEQVKKNDDIIDRKIDRIEKKFNKKLLSEVNDKIEQEVDEQIKDLKKETMGSRKRKKTIKKLVDALTNEDE